MGVVIGSPRHALPESLVRAIADVTAAFAEIVEAHLPLVVVGRGAPAQVLILVFSDSSVAGAVASRVGPQVSALLAQGQHIDVWPLPVHSSLLTVVRRAACQLCKAGKVEVEDNAYRADRVPRKRWQFWRG
jgi:hypothetical protein